MKSMKGMLPPKKAHVPSFDNVKKQEAKQLTKRRARNKAARKARRKNRK